MSSQKPQNDLEGLKRAYLGPKAKKARCASCGTLVARNELWFVQVDSHKFCSDTCFMEWMAKEEI